MLIERKAYTFIVCMLITPVTVSWELFYCQDMKNPRKAPLQFRGHKGEDKYFSYLSYQCRRGVRQSVFF